MSDFPDKPLSPVKTSVTQSTITLSWSQSANKQLPVSGYKLEMDDGFGGPFVTIYNGQNFPNVLQFTKVGLQTGLEYQFRLKALNFNGESIPSDSINYIICSEPKGF